MRQIDVQKIADEAPFTRFHWLIVIWCALAVVFDGYDLAVIGIALPSIMKDMGVNATQAGFMASSALFGMMFGNMLFGSLSDRIGRRLVLCLCIAIFSLGMSPSFVPQPDDQYVMTTNARHQTGTTRSAFRQLFAEGRGVSTLIFWLTCFMALFVVYGLNSWLTKLMAQAGYSLGSALAFRLPTPSRA